MKTKSILYVKSVDMIEYLVTIKGDTMNQKKLEKIKDWKHQRSAKEVQNCIRGGGFYPSFIKNLSKICPLITNLLIEEIRRFTSRKAQQKAFLYLMGSFITARSLCHFNPEYNTVQTDTIDYILGCILLQLSGEMLPSIAFKSRKLNSSELNHDIHDKDLLVILVAFMELKHYLQGTNQPMKVYKEYQNLQYFLMIKARIEPSIP